jgi:hypothetical protein
VDNESKLLLSRTALFTSLRNVDSSMKEGNSFFMMTHFSQRNFCTEVGWGILFPIGTFREKLNWAKIKYQKMQNIPNL